MTTVNALSEVAALMGDPARASMLSLLMDGRAHTASELALTAGVTAQTASGHLSRMVEANLLAARRIAHVLVHAEAQHELIARALGSALGVERADMAVEGGLGPVAVEIDAQETVGRIVWLQV